MQPRICLTGGFDYGDNQRIQRTVSRYYGDALAAAGASASLYVAGSTKDMAKSCQGLMLTGGGDVCPWYQGEGNHGSRQINLTRDEEEFELLDAFAARNKPVFGICRGMQVIQIYLGGRICQHQGEHPLLDHTRGGHWVHLCRHTSALSFLPPRFFVNSYHHQYLSLAAAPWSALAVCPEDGAVEAAQSKDQTLLGVQWHPERMCPGICQDTLLDMLPLFRFWVDRCRF